MLDNAFTTAASGRPKAHNHTDRLSVPLPGDVLVDTRAALKYIYQRVVCSLEVTPSKLLWRSIDEAHPILQFAHKYDMSSVLTVLAECDCCLVQKPVLFHTTNSTVA